ncbi:ribonuclease H [Trifolium pratense]|uniref:Ribonuclease H n=1 Tax=Trifolium pratense TaxID=57577 RepID=A0A2K3KYN1_TRIPR|nr:ribonuclease H [Trifolium pratense]
MANQNPDLIFLMETKLLDSQYHFLTSYKDTYSTHTINCSVTGGGRAGGLALIWNHCNLNIQIMNRDLHYVDMSITTIHTNLNWRATGIYGTTKSQHYSKRFEQIWITDDQHYLITKAAWQTSQGDIKTRLQHTLDNLHGWGRTTFGVLPKKIKATQQALADLQLKPNNSSMTQQITDKEKELDDLLEKEEMWWSQRSRALWLTHGDKNTKFFHLKASQRRKKNRIESITDHMGNNHTEPEKIELVFLNHFQHLFNKQTTTNINDTVQVVKNRISQDMHDQLNQVFTEDEVFHAIKEMKGLAAPGPDGLPAKFYHTYWDIVGKDITEAVLQILNNDGSPAPFNSTHICLIPKTNNPSQPSDFRPISLCNVTLKIITKTIANRIKAILPAIISPNQSAFVPGRLITDNILIANELFHYLTQTTKKTGYVGIKTDMAKAYDRIE